MADIDYITVSFTDGSEVSLNMQDNTEFVRCGSTEARADDLLAKARLLAAAPRLWYALRKLIYACDTESILHGLSKAMWVWVEDARATLEEIEKETEGSVGGDGGGNDAR